MSQNTYERCLTCGQPSDRPWCVVCQETQANIKSKTDLHCRRPLCCGTFYCNCHCANCDEERRKSK